MKTNLKKEYEARRALFPQKVCTICHEDMPWWKMKYCSSACSYSVIKKKVKIYGECLHCEGPIKRKYSMFCSEKCDKLYRKNKERLLQLPE